MKTNTNFPAKGAKTEFMAHQNVAGALVRPNGITLNWYCPLCVLKAVSSHL
jgi:hypothetical protein